MAKRKKKMIKAKSKSQACAIGYSKARAAGKPSKGAAACRSEIVMMNRGRKSPRGLTLLKSKKKGR